MSTNRTQSLISSLETLYTSIEQAITLIKRKDSNSSTLVRLDKYKDICTDQLSLAKTIDLSDPENQEQSYKNITRINGLAELVKEDANDILKEKPESKYAAHWI